MPAPRPAHPDSHCGRTSPLRKDGSTKERKQSIEAWQSQSSLPSCLFRSILTPPSLLRETVIRKPRSRGGLNAYPRCLRPTRPLLSRRRTSPTFLPPRPIRERRAPRNIKKLLLLHPKDDPASSVNTLLYPLQAMSVYHRPHLIPKSSPNSSFPLERCHTKLTTRKPKGFGVISCRWTMFLGTL